MAAGLVCVRAGAFWGVWDWGAGLVRVGGGWGGSALRRALWAAQMSWGRLRIRCRAVDLFLRKTRNSAEN